MSQITNIGLDDWLEENVGDLAHEFYGKAQSDPDDLYYSDPAFKHYCLCEWDNVCDAYQAKYE